MISLLFLGFVLFILVAHLLNVFFTLLFIEVMGIFRFFCFVLLRYRWVSSLCILLVSVVIGAYGVSLIVSLSFNKGGDYLVSSSF